MAYMRACVHAYMRGNLIYAKLPAEICSFGGREPNSEHAVVRFSCLWFHPLPIAEVSVGG